MVIKLNLNIENFPNLSKENLQFADLFLNLKEIRHRNGSHTIIQYIFSQLIHIYHPSQTINLSLQNRQVSFIATPWMLYRHIIIAQLQHDTEKITRIHLGNFVKMEKTIKDYSFEFCVSEQDSFNAAFKFDRIVHRELMAHGVWNLYTNDRIAL